MFMMNFLVFIVCCINVTVLGVLGVMRVKRKYDSLLFKLVFCPGFVGGLTVMVPND